MPEALQEKPSYHDRLIVDLVRSEGLTDDSIIEKTIDPRINHLGNVIRIIKGKAKEVLMGMGLLEDEAEREAEKINELLNAIDVVRSTHSNIETYPSLLDAINKLRNTKVRDWLCEKIPLAKYDKGVGSRIIFPEEKVYYRDACTRDIHIAKLEIRDRVALLLKDLIGTPVIPAESYDRLNAFVDKIDENDPDLGECWEICVQFVEDIPVLGANSKITTLKKREDNEGKLDFVFQVLAECERSDD